MLILFGASFKDNIKLFDYNVQDRVNDFVAAAISQVNGMEMGVFILGFVLPFHPMSHWFCFLIFVSFWQPVLGFKHLLPAPFLCEKLLAAIK